MNVQKVIEKYRVWVDDASELTDQEELDLAQEKWDELLGERTWGFLKKTATVSTTGTEADLPTDFNYIIRIEDDEDDRLFLILTTTVGAEKVQIVNYSERHNHEGQNVAYFDYAENKIKFTNSTTGSIEFDYARVMPELTIEGIVPGERNFGNAIARLMARDFYTLDQTEFGRSQFQSNEQAYQKLLDQLSVKDQRDIISY